MALSSPSGIGTLNGIRDRLALLLGFSDGHGAIGDVGQQQRIDNSVEEALDRLAIDAQFKTFEREGVFNTVLKRTGTDGAINAGTAIFTSAAATFQTWGIAKDDKINYGSLEGWVRVLSVDAETQLTLEIAEPGAVNLTAQAFSIVRDDFVLADDAWWVKRVWDASNARNIRLIGQEQLGIVTGENFETILAASPEPFLAMLVHPSTADTPDHETVGTRLRLYPAPDEGFTIKYTYCKLPTFTSPDLQSGTHLGQLLYFAAASALLLDDDDPQRAQLYEGKYLRQLPMYKKRDQQRGHTRITMREQWRVGSDIDVLPPLQDPKTITGN
jgi:hypothetical protein